jgi:hypothetical protein
MDKIPLVLNDPQEIQVLDNPPMAIPVVEESYLIVSKLTCRTQKRKASNSWAMKIHTSQNSTHLLVVEIFQRCSYHLAPNTSVGSSIVPPQIYDILQGYSL